MEWKLPIWKAVQSQWLFLQELEQSLTFFFKRMIKLLGKANGNEKAQSHMNITERNRKIIGFQLSIMT